MNGWNCVLKIQWGGRGERGGSPVTVLVDYRHLLSELGENVTALL